MNDPNVTVLMPVYNGEQYLREATESILGQIFRDFEFLIINDASTDHSTSIIESYNDPRIRLAHNEMNLGLAKTLNKGLDLARGEYIARMDCDDISLPERLKKQVNFLDENRDIGLCGTWARTIGAVESIWRYPIDDAHIRSRMFFENVVVHSSALFRKDLLKEQGLIYDEAYTCAQDYEFWVRISRHTNLANLDDILVLHRIHNESLGTINREGQKEATNRIRRSQIEELGISPNQKEVSVHNDLGSWNLRCRRSFVQDSHDWLQKLQHANSLAKHYQEPAFSNILAERWYGVCRGARRLGLWSWMTFWRSPLSSFVDLSLKERIGFAARCMLRI